MGSENQAVWKLLGIGMKKKFLVCRIFVAYDLMHHLFVGITYDKKLGEIAVNSAFKAEEFGIDWLIQCFADVPHLGKSIKNAFNNHSQLYIDEKYMTPNEDNNLPKYLETIYENDFLPTNVVDLAAIKAVVEWDKKNELKLAPHLPREILDLGNYYFNI